MPARSGDVQTAEHFREGERGGERERARARATAAISAGVNGSPPLCDHRL